ncbi:phosphoglyceromutase [Rhodobacteraceae bacterium THAF1]|uniref:SixA phosphatase family protein n=1 Tax=Palleronia sp. THAF1 TaxID=2587842 RepID=UPI000F40398E|nr:histidine phosphatase family protein [Palleronia sp. THAF1]QFU07671.1 phosphoglyceromutase [Palleronia sp. THAF1]VDC23120.1 phosphoglyceromutase [Rhodobacteraceae bacterium THAF1]
MSRRLILTRHAKSDWDDGVLTDHERPLNARGHRSAAAIGSWLTERGYVPDLACLSTAQRVVETWAGIAPRLGKEPEVMWDRALYLSSPDTMLNLLAEQTAQTVIVIAHNPGMGSLAQLMAEDPPQNAAFDRFPTCATLVLDFATDNWRIEPLTGRVVDFVVPRDLTD